MHRVTPYSPIHPVRMHELELIKDINVNSKFIAIKGSFESKQSILIDRVVLNKDFLKFGFVFGGVDRL